jgi:hypothetical protein
MAIDADYHRTRIAALYVELAALDGNVNHSALGRSFDFAAARKSIMDQIEWHKKQLVDDEGPFEFVTIAY